MSYTTKWIKHDRLIKRWGIDTFELQQVIESGVLPTFSMYSSVEPEPGEIIEDGYTKINDGIDFKMAFVAQELRFKMDDIERVENENPDFIQSDSAKMAAKEAREFGRLKLEKKKWDKSIKASVQATLFCKDQKTPVTRKQLWDHLSEQKLADIPDTTFEKIWKAIPQHYRSTGGRPSKTNTKQKTVI
jgi:hypothetical protein